MIKSSEINLEEQAQLLAAVVESCDDAIISKLLDGTITSWNKAAEKIFGYKESEAVGKNIRMLIPHKLLSEEDYIIGKIKKGEKIQHYETVRVQKDGGQINISLTVSPVKNSQGQIVGASKICRDISLIKEQRVQSQLLSAIVEGSDDAIISKDLNGTITSWNRGAEKIFGYTPDEALGKNIRMLLPKHLLNEEDMIIGKIKLGEKMEHYETIRVKKDGTPINISLTISPIKDAKGNIIGASKISRDITEKVLAQKELEASNRKLEELNNFKDHFMSMASHELKTPLTVIKANLQVMEMQLENTAYQGFSDRTLKQVNKLSHLISDLLDVSKIQSGQLELDPHNFDLVALTNEVIDNLHITSGSHNPELHFPEEPLMVNADRGRIEQVIVNLLTNAIKYSPEGNKIIITAKEESEGVIFSVEDYGIGIPDKDQEHIFTRFFRVKGMASTFAGSGIGLFVSEQIILRHKGKIWVKSELGKGSVFSFMLPSKRALA